MVVLTFDTKNKIVTLYDEDRKILLADFTNVPTVKVENGFYEVIQAFDSLNGLASKRVPVMRTPINNTLMFIEN